jgi:CRP-like cAMP-binding protein
MEHAHRTTLKSGASLFHQGDASERFYFVAEGKIRLFRIAPSGHEKVVDIVRAGQCFGEALMFRELKHFPVTADALSETTVIGFDNQTFLSILKNDSDICFALMTQMSQRLHSQLNEIENLSLQNALHRLVNYLLRELGENQGTMVLDVPKRLIASQLAIQPETLSRLLRKLTDADIISVDQKQLTLLDKDKLLNLAGDNQPLRSA